MKLRFLALALLMIPTALLAQQPLKARLFGEVGLGFGQTLFFADTRNNLVSALGGGFDPGTGSNLTMAFYFAPVKWKGAGIGGRIKGTFGASVKGDLGDSYIFNFYNLGISAKYFPLYGQFNKGLYIRAGAGFGQFTSKRDGEARKEFKHQYGIGSTLSGSLGWAIPIKKVSLSLETEFEFSSRRGTIDGIGEATFQTGQIGGNLIFCF
ncbi:MAG: hypothetical protein SFW35_06665 [Chitinophagales bacterium]|nr:hypothetical protein [Chitinophagales bacterium]